MEGAKDVEGHQGVQRECERSTEEQSFSSILF